MSKSQLKRLAVQVPEIAALQADIDRLNDRNNKNYKGYIAEIERRQETQRENDLLRAALEEIRTFPRLRMPADIANAVLGPKVKK